MDKLVVRHLIIDEPFCSPHGAVQQAWAETAANLNKEVDQALGVAIFFPPVTSTMLKSRFNSYMKFAKENKAESPFNSGCNEEEEPGEVQQSIEEIHEQYMSFLATKDNDKNSTMASKMGKKAATEIIRRAFLGMKPTEEELDKTPASLRSYDKKKKSSSGGKNSMRPSKGTTKSILSLHDLLVACN